MLNEIGYYNARDYRGGIADWIEAGEPTESTPTAPAPGVAPAQEIEPQATIASGPPLNTSAEGALGRGPAIISHGMWDKSVLGLVRELSTFQLFLIWIGAIVLSGVCFWFGALMGEHGLIEAGRPLGADFRGFASAIYFSFVTATSVGYGDIVPVGGARVVAVTEAIIALLVFGSLIAKLVSHRQDELVAEIHRVTFEERLDRVETNLHTVISELLAINGMCDARAPLPRITTRLESAAILFLAETRTIRDLLYQPRLIVEEGVLSAILASLASALSVLGDVFSCLPADFTRSEPLKVALDRLTGLAEEICGECVPHTYTPRLVFWMDRIQATARRLK